MDVITGKVVKVAIDVDVAKKDGGTYKAWKLVYEDAAGDVKTVAKPIGGLKYNAALKKGLESLKEGDAFTLNQEKEGDFWVPKTIAKGGAVTTTKAPATKSEPARASSGSTYSTAEERAQTQIYIIRQSSLTTALKLMELQGCSVGDEPTEAEVIKLAKVFETWVMTGKMPVSEDAMAALTDLESDIPF